MPSVWITDDVHPLLIEAFQQRGYEVRYDPGVSYEQVCHEAHAYEGLIINSKIKANADFLRQAKRLQFIGRLGSGLDIIDLEVAKQLGVRVYSAPEGNRNAVAEHALAMLLNLTNKLCSADAQLRQHNWQREAHRGYEVMGKTVGIIGFGNNGQAFAKKLAGMGVNVLAYDKYRIRFAEGYAYLKAASLATILVEADIISLHVPLTPETHHLVNAAFINSWKKNGILINCARGGVVDTAAVVAALEEDRLQGACLDVFENEKPHTFTPQERDMYNRLYALPQVVLSPHVAGWTHASKRRIAEVLIEKLF